MDNYNMKNQFINLMINCRKYRIKINKISDKIELSNYIVKLIYIFLRYKKYIKSIEFMKNESNDLHEYQMKIYYFVNINPFPSKKKINKIIKNMGIHIFHQFLDMDK